MVDRDQRPHPERKHLDTAPMKDVLRTVFKIHRGNHTTRVEHVGLYPTWSPIPIDRIQSSVFSPPRDEPELMSGDQHDYVSHKLDLIRPNGSDRTIVVSQNGVVRSISVIPNEIAIGDPDELMRKIEGEFIGTGFDAYVLGEGEVSSLLLSLVEGSGIPSLLLDEERLMLDPNSNTQLEPFTLGLLKRTIEQLATIDSIYESKIRSGDKTIKITTTIPFGCEPESNSFIPDSVANSSSVSVEVVTPSSSDDRYQTVKTWNYHVGQSHYSAYNELTPGYIWKKGVDEREDDERAELTRSELDKSRDISDAIKEHGLPPMTPSEWKEGMDILNT